MKLFGFTFNFGKKKAPAPDDVIRGQEDRGTVVLATSGDRLLHTTSFLSVFETEKEQIETYRSVAKSTYVDSAIDDIVTEAVNYDPSNPQVVKINLDRTKFSANIKKQISEEFNNLLEIMAFSKKADEYFREWYVDGRQFFYIVVSKEKKEGIKEIRKLDSRYVKRVKKVFYDSSRSFEQNLYSPKTEISYIFVVPTLETHDFSWMSQFRAFQDSNVVEINEEAIAYSDSGLFSIEEQVESYIQKAIKPFNMLSMLEDATVIYRISRAPERRVFYVDVGDMPTSKAHEWMSTLINRFKNNLTYNPETGTFTGQHAQRAMIEDIWLPTRGDAKSTKIDTLPAGQNLGELTDVQYFRALLYKSLKIPVSRLEQEGTFNLGRASEITRDEVKFSKYIFKLTQKYSEIFYDLLKKQLVLKNVIDADEWIENRDLIDFVFESNSFFSELKKLEIIKERHAVLGDADTHVGKYYSKAWVQRNVLGMTKEEVKEIEKEIEKELKNNEIPDISTLPPEALQGAVEPIGITPDGKLTEAPSDQQQDDSERATSEAIVVLESLGLS